MPYPNSQTPVTIRLNQLFGNPAAMVAAGGIADLQNAQQSLAALAASKKYHVVYGKFGRKHVKDWPSTQQMFLRRVMLLALQTLTPIFFDWHTASNTSIEVVYFGDDRVFGVTMRSPRAYPPYWGP